MKFPFDIIIPARFASQRLPGKPLRDICGKSLIERVYECARNSSADSITVASDDETILRVAESFGANVCLTGSHHENGTARVAEAVQILKFDDQRIVINLQGDEPRMPGPLINQVAEALAKEPKARIATACRQLESREEYLTSNVVKVVRNQKNFALYFSRAPIPANRSTSLIVQDGTQWQFIRRHIGLYAYRVSYLKTYLEQSPTPLEKIEKLEQLRALWYGESILVCDAVKAPGPGVDTVEDLEGAIRYFSEL
jgi:3-deoxy-manno-octulosonate cytidylyltransferase (CMP-KDO synthetase)